MAEFFAADVYQISKTFGFAASHALTGLPAGHKCLRLHGHNYQVTVTVEAAALDATGMVMDYAELGPFRDWLKAEVDHRHLGWGDCYNALGEITDPAVFDFNPTAENLAAAFLAQAQRLLTPAIIAVEVRETAATSAVATATAARVPGRRAFVHLGQDPST